MVAASALTSGESMRRGRSIDDGELVHHPTGPAREQHHPVAESHRLAHVVGHEHDGEVGLAPEPFELVVEHVAGHRVERTERLVHEEDVDVLRERAGERDALAHAAGQLVRALVAEASEVHERRGARRAWRGARPSATLANFSGKLDVARVR